VSEPPRVVLASLSAAMDAGFTAIADVSACLAAVGADDDYRLIGGVAVMLHVQRLGLALPLRATGDADVGIPPAVLRDPALVSQIEALGYRKVRGNRWERDLDGTRVAAVDLLIPAYTSRARDTVRVGDIVTTEVPGLAAALLRPGVVVRAELRLTTGEACETSVVLPDALATLELKTRARSVRDEERDSQDLWRCLEIAAADGVTPDLVVAEGGEGLRELLRDELGPAGASLTAVTRGLQQDAATRLRTRIRFLLADTIGIA